MFPSSPPLCPNSLVRLFLRMSALDVQNLASFNSPEFQILVRKGLRDLGLVFLPTPAGSNRKPLNYELQFVLYISRCQTDFQLRFQMVRCATQSCNEVAA